MTRDFYQQPWKRFTNKYIHMCPPATLSKDDVNFTERYLKKNPRILILGCTISYRKLIGKYKLPVTLVDLNKEMYKANNRVIKNINKKEKLVIDNWLTMDLKKKFDLILGDGVINNIPVNKLDVFYKNIKKHLKNNGLFITRIIVQPKQLSKNSVFNYYKDKKITHELITALWLDSVYQFALDKKNHTGDNIKGYYALKNSIKDYPYMNKWLAAYEKFIPIDDKKWTIFTNAVQKNQLKKTFKIIDVFNPTDYKYCKECPTYVLR